MGIMMDPSDVMPREDKNISWLTVPTENRFNDAEIGILMELHRRIVRLGGVLNFRRFRKVVAALNVPDLWITFPNRAFAICDTDNDGIINENEWICFLSLICRSNAEDLLKLQKGQELQCNYDETIAAESQRPPSSTLHVGHSSTTSINSGREFINENNFKSKSPPTTPSKSIQSIDKGSPVLDVVEATTTPLKLNHKSESFRTYTSQLKHCTINTEFQDKMHNSTYMENLVEKKKSAIAKIHKLLPDSSVSTADLVFKERLWGVVVKEPRLLNAWATSSMPTATLLSVSKALMNVHGRGKLKYYHEQNEDNEDWEIWEKQQNLRRIYGLQRNQQNDNSQKFLTPTVI